MAKKVIRYAAIGYALYIASGVVRVWYSCKEGVLESLFETEFYIFLQPWELHRAAGICDMLRGL